MPNTLEGKTRASREGPIGPSRPHDPVSGDSARKRVVMLVSNACTHDTRVIRAAETVAQLGFDTVVLAVSDDETTSEEEHNGVLYRRIGRRFALPSAARGSRVRLFKNELGSAVSKGSSLRVRLRFALRSSELAARFVLARLLPRTLSIRALTETRRIRNAFMDDLVRLNPDIIHAHDLATLPAGAQAAKAVGSKLIYDAHELEVHRNTNVGQIDKFLRYHLEKKYIVACDAVVTVCDSIADHLAREYTIARPVVVMNAPDPQKAQPSDKSIRQVLGLSADVPLVVYVGHITIGRGIEQIVQALEHLPGLHLALIGPANSETVEDAQSRARALQVTDRLHIVDPVASNQVVSFIGSADLSVVPIQNVCLSYYYCLPNKLLESALAGLPVVVSNLPELRRFAEASRSGVTMDETDPRDIARAIQEAYGSAARLRPDAERLQRIGKMYGWETQRSELEALYAALAPNPIAAGGSR